jgi:hypothetical protein
MMRTALVTLGAFHILTETSKLVMPGLVPGIHVLSSHKIKDVDGRDEPGHDDII